MPKDDIYCGLDIGSGRVTAILARYNEESDELEILSGKQSVDRDAFTAGVIKDVEKASSVISETINEVEESVKTNLTNLIVGVRGRFVQTFNTRAQVPITSTDKTITLEDQEKVEDLAIKSLRISSEREIIDVIPQDYIIDGQPGINNPIGMEGSMLELEAHIVVAHSTFLRNIERTLANANYAPEKIIYSLIPVSEIVTESEERKLGTLVIDFNGQTTGVVIYSDGYIKYSKEFYNTEVDIGSDMITRDISSYYKTSWNIAENIKQQYGVAKPSLVKKDEQIDIPSRDGKTMKSTTRKVLSQVIAARLEDLFLDRIIPELKNTNLLDIVLRSGDIVLTGGGANMPGITKAIEDLFSHECGIEVEARVGTVGLETGVVGAEDIISNFSYTTAISLIKYEIAHMRKNVGLKRGSKKISLFKKLWQLFE
jgi:cell division protein FtsA